MNARQLLDNVRGRLDDTVGNGSRYLWSDDEIINDYAAETLVRMFLLTRSLLTDMSTASDLSTVPVPLCKLPVVAATGRYALSQKIIRVMSIQLASQQQPLAIRLAAELDHQAPGWRGSQAALGKPWAACFDLETDAVTFYPAPVADDTATLRVYRFPLKPITLSNPLPFEWREEYHKDLIPGILALAWSKRDSQTVNDKLAAFEEAKFINRMDEIKLELIRRNSTVHTNRRHH
jgi:hypothetical protein